MKEKPESVMVDGTKFVREDLVKGSDKAKTMNGKPYVIIRTYSAGVFAGYLVKREGKEAVIADARRIWYWEGAASLSQLAIDGTSKPEKCKFPQEVSNITVTEVIEVLDVSEKARASISAVPAWKQ